MLSHKSSTILVSFLIAVAIFVAHVHADTYDGASSVPSSSEGSASPSSSSTSSTYAGSSSQPSSQSVASSSTYDGSSSSSQSTSSSSQGSASSTYGGSSSQSQSASSSSTSQGVCGVGLYLNDTVCTVCPANHYCADGNTARPCTGHSTSQVGSDQPEDCLCDRGYAGEPGTVCNGCNAGRYSDSIGAVNCTICSAGKYGATTALTTSDCTGVCAANHYCPAYSTTDRAYPCPIDRSSSPPGSGSEDNCVSTSSQQDCIPLNLTSNCFGYSWQGSQCSCEPDDVTLDVGCYVLTIGGSWIHAHPVVFSTTSDNDVSLWSGASPNLAGGSISGEITLTVTAADRGTAIYYRSVKDDFYGRLWLVGSSDSASADSSVAGSVVIDTPTSGVRTSNTHVGTTVVTMIGLMAIAAIKFTFRGF